MISSPIIPIGPSIFLSKILAGNILNISKILKTRNDMIISVMLPSHINKGIDWPMNSSITISLGSLLLNIFNIFFKKKKWVRHYN